MLSDITQEGEDGSKSMTAEILKFVFSSHSISYLP